MAKITKALLKDKLYQVKQASTDIYACVGEAEIKRGVVHLKKVGLELIRMSEGVLNHHAKKLIPLVERQIDLNVTQLSKYPQL